MSRKKRKGPSFNLSFLDSICCGFGAIILLFVLSLGVETTRISELRNILQNIVQQRMLKLSEYQTRAEELQTLLTREKEIADEVESEVVDLEAMIAKLKQQIQDKDASKDEFLVDIEQIEEEIAAMQKDLEIEQKEVEPTPVGLPVESTHIAFVIDTSGSMRDGATNLLIGHVGIKLEQILESYPEVKGIQLLDANGRFMLGRSAAGGWLEDSPQVRETMVRTARLYPHESNSNPVPGIVRAIRTLADPKNEEMKMGLFVMGDEFTGRSDKVLNPIDKLNRRADGERMVRINAIGFPNVIRQTLFMGQSGLKFANLMRELTYAHNGAFIALNRASMRDSEREMERRVPAPPPPPPRRMPGSIIFGP